MATNLIASDVDATGGSAIAVRGFVLNRRAPRAAALRTLMASYQFDLVPRNGVLTLILRGGVSTETLDEDTLGARFIGQEHVEPLVKRGPDEATLPKSYGVRFLDYDHGYEDGHQTSQRLASAGGNDLNADIAVVLTNDEAAQVASVLLHRAHVESVTYTGRAMPSKQSAIQPAKIATATVNSVAYKMRIDTASIIEGGIVEMRAVRYDESVYSDFSVGGSPYSSVRGVPIAGQTLAFLLDVPMLRDADNYPLIYIAATSYSPGWPGAEIFVSADGSAYGSKLFLNQKATIGHTIDALGDANDNEIDWDSELRVALISGTLSSINHDTMMTSKDANYAIIGKSGRFEVIRFINATLNLDGSYTLTGIFRGLLDTYANTGNHAGGDYFILISDAYIRSISIESSLINTSQYLKAVTFGKSISQVTPLNLSSTAQNMVPFGPHSLHAEKSGSDWTLSWSRQDRKRSNLLQEPPMSESTESYTVRVLDYGGAELDSYTSTSTSYIYDGNGQVGNVDYLHWDVAQVSAFVGDGHRTAMASGRFSDIYDSIITSRSSLVDFWRMDETSGTICYSNSGTRDLDYKNGPLLNQTGVIYNGDAAVLFDGTNDIASKSGVDLSTVKSLELWFRIETAVPGIPEAVLVHAPSLNFSRRIACYLFGNKFIFQAYDAAAILAIHIESNIDIEAGENYHVVCNLDTANGGLSEIYINGTIDNSGIAMGEWGFASSNVLVFAGEPQTAYKQPHMTAQKFAAYSSKLSQNEIFQSSLAGLGPI